MAIGNQPSRAREVEGFAVDDPGEESYLDRADGCCPRHPKKPLSPKMKTKPPLPSLIPKPRENPPDRPDASLDLIPEEKRWDPVPGSEGHQAPETPSEGEDEDGHNESAQLVEEGIEEAERDLGARAARAAEKSEWREPSGGNAKG
jgi:hypothetical protein